jgi:hypothetical protein
MHEAVRKSTYDRRQFGGKTRPTGEWEEVMARKKTAMWMAIAGTVAVVAGLVWLGVRHWQPRWTIIQGATIRRDSDTRKEAPIAGVSITASHGDSVITSQSDASGYFKIAFPGTVLPGQTVTLSFRHADYRPVDLSVIIRFRSSLRRLVVVAMDPAKSSANIDSDSSAPAVSNIKVRYTVNLQSEENIGNAVRVFQVVNRGNVPCRHRYPCSPGGDWKAAYASVELDAGNGNEFRDARASCIAGPCPFTRIAPTGFAGDERTIVVSALDWSDTVTFLVEAEVFHKAIVSNVRESYPVVFGRSVSFTLPSSAEGVSFEAELNGLPMVFPLGPELYLSWATCSARPSSQADKSTVYQCELKPGYRF